jgi:tetratricopeptide (TPR) repeat protein
MKDAAASWRRAIELEPDHANAHSNLGMAYRELGLLKQSAEAYRAALSLDEDNPYAHFSLGVVLREDGRNGEASACFKHALRLRPGYVDALYMQALMHEFRPGEAAFERLEQAFAETANDGEDGNDRIILSFALGKALHDMADYDNAFEHFARGNTGMKKRFDYHRMAHRLIIAETRRAYPGNSEIPDISEAGDQQAPIFVIGMSRSGKTLVESLLAEQPGVFAAGEQIEMASAAQSVITEHGLDKKVFAVEGAASGEELDKLAAALRAQLSEADPDARYYVATSPANFSHVGLILSALPNARVIFCRRDPRDNCLFIYFTRYRRRHEYSYDPGDLAAYHADYSALLDHWKTIFGDRILEVQYEDLVTGTDRIAADIFRHCGLDANAKPGATELHSNEIGQWRNYRQHLTELFETL